jgi:hypothetical protein
VRAGAEWTRVVTAVLAYLRGRPWLASCVLMVAIGLGILVINRHGYLLTLAGILAMAGGLLGIVSGELGRRRERADRAEDHDQPRAD